MHSWAVVPVLGQIFRQIVSIRVMTLIHTNVVASRHIKMEEREEVLLPVAVRRSKTPEIKFTTISRKVVGKNVHATIPKSNMGYDQYTVPAFL